MMGHDGKEASNGTAKLISPQMYLNGLSPREQSLNNLVAVTNHLLEFGFTTAPLIQLLLNKLGRNWPSGAVRKGYLRENRTPSGCPAVIYTLTADGLNFALRHSDTDIEYPELDPRRINYSNLRHSLYTQEVCLFLKQKDGLRKISGPRRYPEGYEYRKKVPDAIFHHAKLGRVAFEAELTGKWGRDFDDFRLKVLRAMMPDGVSKPRFNCFLIASDSKVIIKRYRDGFAPDLVIPGWTKSDGKWHRDEDDALRILPELSQRVHFFHADFSRNPARPHGRKLEAQTG